MSPPRLFAFGPFQLDESLQELRRNGRPVPLTPLAFALLRYLISHRDRLVHKDELIKELWETPFVTDWAIAAVLREVRRALGDDGSQQRWLKTQRKRGYRFVQDVRAMGTEEAQEGDELARRLARFLGNRGVLIIVRDL